MRRYAFASLLSIHAPRGLPSFTSQLNLSAFYGIGGARRGCAARVKGVFRVCKVFGVCLTRLK